MRTSAFDSLRAAREELRDVTPLKSDCGRLCGAACCLPMVSEGGHSSGMYLFPGEGALYESCGWARVLPAAWTVGCRKVPLLVCEGSCPRENRPMACRIFPLCARSDGPGFILQLDPRAWPVCPLMPHGLSAMDPAFVAAARVALDALWSCPEHRAFLLALDGLIAQHESF